MAGSNLGRRSRISLRFTVAAIAALWAAVLAPSVVAHVNRTVGPYTILVILVEEPTFEDNHAGFQFWVRKDGAPITGLERTVHAVAIGHDQRLELAVPPVDASGFHVLDRSTDGTPFDPRGGGAWTLFLAGSIEGTPLDASFPVIFPSYPRVAVADAPPAGADARATGAMIPAGLGLLIPVVALLAAGFAGLAIVRRRRSGAPEAT
jgi:hypothetical protein